jgi:hypothetical protein
MTSTCPSDPSPAPGSIDDPTVRLATIRDRIAAVDPEEKGYAFAYRDDAAFLLGRLDEQAADVAKLREALSPRSASWSQRALDVAPLLLGLCASASADDRGALRVRNGTKPPQTPITDSQEGAIEVFLEEGPAAMLALVAERDELTAALDTAAKESLSGLTVNTSGGLVERVRRLAEERTQAQRNVEAANAERDELRLEIAAMRGREEGRLSDRWTWRADGWELDATKPPKCAARVEVVMRSMWTGGVNTEPVDSIRDGMRRCEARLAGGAS